METSGKDRSWRRPRAPGPTQIALPGRVTQLSTHPRHGYYTRPGLARRLETNKATGSPHRQEQETLSWHMCLRSRTWPWGWASGVGRKWAKRSEQEFIFSPLPQEEGMVTCFNIHGGARPWSEHFTHSNPSNLHNPWGPH